MLNRPGFVGQAAIAAILAPLLVPGAGYRLLTLGSSHLILNGKHLVLHG